MPNTSDPAVFIQAAFQQFLHRDAEASAISGYTHVLAWQNGKALISSIVHSPEWAVQNAGATAAVTAAYRELLNRDANGDQNGLNFWVGVVNSNGVTPMLNGFLNSEEYKDTYGDNGLPGQSLVWVTPVTDEERIQSYQACVSAQDKQLLKDALPFIGGVLSGDAEAAATGWAKMVDNQLGEMPSNCMDLLTPTQKDALIRAWQTNRDEGFGPGPGGRPRPA